MDDIELTESEQEFLALLFNIGENIIDSSNGYELKNTYATFTDNDLYNLACKLHIEGNY